MCTYFCTVRSRASMHKEGSVSLVTLSSSFGAGSEERDPPCHKGNVVLEEKLLEYAFEALRGSLPWI